MQAHVEGWLEAYGRSLRGAAEGSGQEARQGGVQGTADSTAQPPAKRRRGMQGGPIFVPAAIRCSLCPSTLVLNPQGLVEHVRSKRHFKRCTARGWSRGRVFDSLTWNGPAVDRAGHVDGTCKGSAGS